MGLDVAVDDALLVGVLQGVGDSAEDAPDLGLRQPPLALEALGEGLSLHVAHHVVENSLVLAERVQRDDVGVAEPRRRPRLPSESLAMGAGLGPLGRRPDRDEPVEPGLLGEVDGAHAASSDLAHDPVVGPERRLQQLPQPVRRGSLGPDALAAVGAEPGPLDQRAAARGTGHVESSGCPGIIRANSPRRPRVGRLSGGVSAARSRAAPEGRRATSARARPRPSSSEVAASLGLTHGPVNAK